MSPLLFLVFFVVLGLAGIVALGVVGGLVASAEEYRKTKALEAKKIKAELARQEAETRRILVEAGIDPDLVNLDLKEN